MIPSKKVVLALSLLIGLVAIGTTGYMFIEGYGFIDALYMAVITLGTVGYREVEPLSDPGKVFTIFLIIAGIGSVAYGVTQAVEYVISTIVFQRRRMERNIARLSNHIIICGYGRIGQQVASRLRARGAEFVIIEQDEQVMETLDTLGYLYVNGNATDDNSLKRARLDEANTIVVTLPTNADNVYVTLSARNLRPDIRIVARASDGPSATKLQQAGADKVISPYEIGGRYIANAVLRPHVVNFMDVVNASHDIAARSMEIEELEVTEHCSYAQQALKDTNIRSELNIIVLAIRTPDGEFEYNPAPTTLLVPGSMLICIGYASNLDRLARLLGVSA
ncbi:MAG: potassium channel protein [Ignavibacteria bacterium]|nr:MAG: potassium channel protein [Ignavibacteria bacterium]